MSSVHPTEKLSHGEESSWIPEGVLIRYDASYVAATSLGTRAMVLSLLWMVYETTRAVGRKNIFQCRADAPRLLKSFRSASIR